MSNSPRSLLLNTLILHQTFIWTTKIVNMYPCPKCNKRFHSSGARSSHITQGHNNHSSIAVVEPQFKPPKLIVIPPSDKNYIDEASIFDENDDSVSNTSHASLPYKSSDNEQKKKESTSCISHPLIPNQDSSYKTTSEYDCNDSSSLNSDTISNTTNIMEPMECNKNDYFYNPILGKIFNTDVGPHETGIIDPDFSTFVMSSHTTNFKHYCKLLDLCQNLGTSLDGFSLFLNWSQSASNEGFNFNSSHPTCNKLVQQLKTFVGLPPPEPVTIALEHPVGAKEEDKKITVWQYDFFSQFI